MYALAIPLCLLESAVLHHTSVGEMYSVIAHCVCESEQESESYIVSSAVMKKERIVFTSDWDTGSIRAD